MLKQHVLNTIKNNGLLQKGEGVVVGVSGGYDSICLLHVLYQLSQQLDIKLYPVHINHMLRGQEALRDERFVEDFCRSLNIKPIIFKIDVAKLAQNDKISLEEAGRNARYDAFSQTLVRTGATKIAVAHNKNDQVETVLMRIFRGTGTEGMLGMSHLRGNIIRPLLDVSRLDIEQYVHENGLSAIVDSSNLETDYTRNKVRLNLLPAINEAMGIDVSDNILRLSSIIRMDEQYLSKQAQIAYSKVCSVSGLENKNNTAWDTANSAKCDTANQRNTECDAANQRNTAWDTLARSNTASGAENLSDTLSKVVRLRIELLQGLDSAIRTRVLRLAIKQVKGNLKGIESIHIDRLNELCISGRSGSSIDIKQGIIATRQYDNIKLSFKSTKQTKDFCEKLNIPGITIVEDTSMQITTEVIVAETMSNSKDKLDIKQLMNSEKEAYFDLDLIKKAKERYLVQSDIYTTQASELVVRNRQSGDVFKPFKSNGTKKLKEYLIDEKVPKEIRSSIPLIAAGQEIIWIIGKKTSDNYRVTDNTKFILKISFSDSASKKEGDLSDNGCNRKGSNN